MMADTDLDDDVNLNEDEDLGEFDEDEDIDFEHLVPGDGAYEVEIKDVEWRDYNRESDGNRIRALNVRVQLVTDDEFNGLLVSKFIYMGDQKLNPIGRQQMKALAEACNITVEGQMSLRDFGPVSQTIGTRQARVLSVFSGLRCGVFLKEYERTYQGKTVTGTEPDSFITLDRLAEIQNTELDPEPY